MTEEKKISNWFSRHEVSLVLCGAILAFLWSTHSLDNRMLAMDERMLAQEQRIDKLYEMFVDLVKENKKG